MTRSAVTKLVVLVCAMVPAVGQRNAPVAAEHEIACPVADVRTDITTSIPKPWWTTPQIGKLQSVGIQVIAGEKTLVCRYSAYGTQVSVMRKFPEGARDCRAAGNHFVCR
ncbi:MAG: hypothetical protein LAO78_20035 [Acidobacteriia bacterium]|nr:hypothetical protein [Terriglobia bacterium]